MRTERINLRFVGTTSRQLVESGLNVMAHSDARYEHGRETDEWSR